ncbi:unnamed protein product, partial [Ectocarpus sp. 4 AP-2014]
LRSPSPPPAEVTDSTEEDDVAAQIPPPLPLPLPSSPAASPCENDDELLSPLPLDAKPMPVLPAAAESSETFRRLRNGGRPEDDPSSLCFCFLFFLLLLRRRPAAVANAVRRTPRRRRGFGCS